MAYPLLISIANIDPAIRTKISMHTYLLLALLPVTKFIHKDTRTRGLLHDRLIHQALQEVLEPVKIAARVGIMMNDPVGNLRYCYTPLAAFIADTPEQCLMACTSPKASPLTTATSKQFGDPVPHPPRTGSLTLDAICRAVEERPPQDYKGFLKVAKSLYLNGVIEPFWVDWPLSCPSNFLHPEPLHHFHKFSWDHDVKWCVEVVTPVEIDFRFSVLQPAVGYRGFDDGISKLKQVTGRDHRSVQRYIVGIIAGAVPRRFLIAIRALVDFRYLAQAPVFSDQTLDRLTDALQLFHENKDAVTRAGARRDSWEIPKLELLQSVVSSIRRSGPVMQWSADATEHAHVQEIKVPAWSSNNQNYYDQIARYLDRSDKCFRFDVATDSVARQEHYLSDEEDFDRDDDPDDSNTSSLPASNISRPPINYFVIADDIARGRILNALRPHRTFANSTTAFHIAEKPSLRTTVDEAATLFGIPDLRPAIWEFLQRVQDGTNTHDVSGIRTQDPRCPLPFDRVQIWYKLRIQQYLYHEDERVDAPQTLRVLPPSPDRPHGVYDSVIISPGPDTSDWPRRGIEGTHIELPFKCALLLNTRTVGHAVVQLRLIFRPMNTEHIAAYVQRFDVVSQQGSPNNVHPGTGMHLLRRATKASGTRVGDVIPVSHIRSAAPLIPNFGKEAHSRLSRQNSYEVSSDFWLNKYWSKEIYYALCPF